VLAVVSAAVGAGGGLLVRRARDVPDEPARATGRLAARAVANLESYAPRGISKKLGRLGAPGLIALGADVGREIRDREALPETEREALLISIKKSCKTLSQGADQDDRERLEDLLEVMIHRHRISYTMREWREFRKRK
jgi:hypothetical protein